MDGIIQVFIRGRYRSVELCLALAAVLPTRTADFERDLNFSAAQARSFMLQRQNMFLHKIAEILEEDGALDKADLWYRRVCAISVDPDADILPEHQANDLGNRAVCLRKMDKLRESKDYDQGLAIPRPTSPPRSQPPDVPPRAGGVDGDEPRVCGGSRDV